MKQNMVTWFEIPVSDMERAKAFYEKVFDIQISIQDFGGVLMGWFPHEGRYTRSYGHLNQERKLYTQRARSSTVFSL